MVSIVFWPGLVYQTDLPFTRQLFNINYRHAIGKRFRQSGATDRRAAAVL